MSVTESAGAVKPEEKKEDGLVDLMKEWKALGRSLRERNLRGRPILPVYWWQAHPGFDLDNALALSSRLLAEQGLWDFQGTQPYIPVKLYYSETARHEFPALARLRHTLQAAAGYRPCFRGLLCVDISDWIGRYAELRFEHFLEFIADQRQNLVVVLLIVPAPGEILDDFTAFVRSRLRIRPLVVNSLAPDDKAIVVQELLRAQGFHLDKGAWRQLKQELNEAAFWDSAQALSRLAEELIYSRFSGEDPGGCRIKAADVQDVMGIYHGLDPASKTKRPEKAERAEETERAKRIIGFQPSRERERIA